MSSPVFTEQQQFSRPLILLLIGVPVICVLTGFIFFRPDKPALLLAVVIMIPVFLLLYYAKLYTRIDHEGVHYSFRPLIAKKRLIKWGDIAHCYTREYDAILEYGGYGWRLGIFGKGRAYNVSGREGLQIELKSGKKILLGTKRPDEAEEVASYYYRKYNVA